MRELRQTSCIGVLQALQIDSVINDKAVPRQAEGKILGNVWDQAGVGA